MSVSSAGFSCHLALSRKAVPLLVYIFRARFRFWLTNKWITFDLKWFDDLQSVFILGPLIKQLEDDCSPEHICRTLFLGRPISTYCRIWGTTTTNMSNLKVFTLWVLQQPAVNPGRVFVLQTSSCSLKVIPLNLEQFRCVPQEGAGPLPALPSYYGEGRERKGVPPPLPKIKQQGCFLINSHKTSAVVY